MHEREAWRKRHGQTEGLRCFQVEEQFDLGGLLHRKVSRLLALEDAARIDADKTHIIVEAVPVARQAAGGHEIAI